MVFLYYFLHCGKKKCIVNYSEHKNVKRLMDINERDSILELAPGLVNMFIDRVPWVILSCFLSLHREYSLMNIRRKIFIIIAKTTFQSPVTIVLHIFPKHIFVYSINLFRTKFSFYKTSRWQLIYPNYQSSPKFHFCILHSKINSLTNSWSIFMALNECCLHERLDDNSFDLCWHSLV